MVRRRNLTSVGKHEAVMGSSKVTELLMAPLNLQHVTACLGQREVPLKPLKFVCVYIYNVIYFIEIHRRSHLAEPASPAVFAVS